MNLRQRSKVCSWGEYELWENFAIDLYCNEKRVNKRRLPLKKIACVAKKADDKNYRPPKFLNKKTIAYVKVAILTFCETYASGLMKRGAILRKPPIFAITDPYSGDKLLIKYEVIGKCKDVKIKAIKRIKEYVPEAEI